MPGLLGSRAEVTPGAPFNASMLVRAPRSCSCASVMTSMTAGCFARREDPAASRCVPVRRATTRDRRNPRRRLLARHLSPAQARTPAPSLRPAPSPVPQPTLSPAPTRSFVIPRRPAPALKPTPLRQRASRHRSPGARAGRSTFRFSKQYLPAPAASTTRRRTARIELARATGTRARSPTRTASSTNLVSVVETARATGADERQPRGGARL